MPICPLGVERMVTDSQVRRLIRLSKIEQDQEIAAAKAGMDAKTARKYLRVTRLPSELRTDRQWRTREDGFSEVWEEIRQEVEVNPGLEAKTLLSGCSANILGSTRMDNCGLYSGGSKCGVRPKDRHKKYFSARSTSRGGCAHRISRT